VCGPEEDYAASYQTARRETIPAARHALRFLRTHDKIRGMSAETPTPAPPAHHTPADEHKHDPSQPVLHRVCTQCNNMFVVTPDRYDAKQCPNCHKG
jgi:hypothetical protein